MKKRWVDQTKEQVTTEKIRQWHAFFLNTWNERLSNISDLEHSVTPQRPSSDAELFMSQTWFELRVTKLRFFVLFRPAEYNDCSRTKFKRWKMHISVNCANKIHYNNLCIKFSTWKVRGLSQNHSRVAPNTKFLAGLGEKNNWAVPNWNRHS